MNTIRIFFNSGKSKLDFISIGCKNVFLQGTWDEEVYMALPLGHEKEGDATVICKLNKLIYELKQSSRTYYEN
jgi:Reverse transcriptase (RNA-dependent DNA polymerase)